MSNTLSLKEVSNYLHLTMDTDEDHAMLVHFEKYKAYHFRESRNDLYYLDISDPKIISLTVNNTVSDYYFYLV